MGRVLRQLRLLVLRGQIKVLPNAMAVGQQSADRTSVNMNSCLQWQHLPVTYTMVT